MTVGPVSRTDSTAWFFDGTAAGEFRLLRCRPNGHFCRPQAAVCPECGSLDLEQSPASGRATLVSWAVIPARGGEGAGGEEPTVAVVVELEEGPWWWSKLVRAEPSSLREGQPLEVTFERAEGGEAVPVFVPADWSL